MTINTKAAVMDTLDYWKIELNNNEIKPEFIFNQVTKEYDGAAYLLEHIDSTDFLNVYYFTDAPCGTCTSKLEIRDSSGAVIFVMEKPFVRTPFKLPGDEIKKILQSHKQVYIYLGTNYKDWAWRLLGILAIKGGK